MKLSLTPRDVTYTVSYSVSILFMDAGGAARVAMPGCGAAMARWQSRMCVGARARAVGVAWHLVFFALIQRQSAHEYIELYSAFYALPVTGH